MFEKNTEKDVVTDKIANLSLKDITISKPSELSAPNVKESSGDGQSHTETDSTQPQENIPISEQKDSEPKDTPPIVYKSNIKKFNFLQTQLSDDKLDDNSTSDNTESLKTEHKDENYSKSLEKSDIPEKKVDDDLNTNEEVSNITDDIRIAIGHNSSNVDNTLLEKNEVIKTEQDQEVSISVPPRRKKQLSSPDKVASTLVKKEGNKSQVKEYPDHLNPFSDEEDEVMYLISNKVI